MSLPERVRKLAPVGAWLLAMALGVLLIARSQFAADLSAFLPSNPDPQQRVVLDQLENGIASRTLFVGIDGGSAEQRAAASRRFAAALRASGAFDQVQNGDAGAWEPVGQWLLAHRYLLSPAVTPERFTAAGLHEALQDTLSTLGTPGGAVTGALLERDPTGELTRIGEALLPSSAPRSEGGVWASRTQPRAVLIATTRADGGDLDAQAAALQRLRAAFAPEAAQGLVLQVSGAPVFAVDSRERIQREAVHLAIGGAVAITTLLLLAFASLRALVVSVLPVATGVVCGIAAVGVVFGTVHGMTLGFGSTLIGEAVDYAIYYLIQARNGWREWRRLSWPTVRLGVLTSVCGFAALVFSGFPGLAQLGVFSIAGLVGAALATRYVMPVLAPAGATGQGLRRQMGRLAAGALRWLPHARVPLYWLGVGALVMLLAKGSSVWTGDLASMSPVGQEALALDAALREDLGASDARTLVVAGGADRESALRAAEAAAERLQPLVARGVIAGLDTPSSLLPSQATQRARQASLPDAAALRAALAEATRGTPLRAERLAPFVDEVQAARRQPLADRASLEGTPLAAAFDAQFFERSGGGWAAMVSLHAPPQGVDAAAVAQALQGLPDTRVVDIKHELDRLYERYLHQALLQALLGALAVVLLLAAWLRSPRRLYAVCRPLALAVALTLAGLALSGAALGVLHLVGLLLVVAVGSNYALFFDQLQEEGGAPDDDTLASLLLANLTTVVSFGLIAISGIPALSSIGRVVAPGALLALLLAAALGRGGVRKSPASPKT